MFGWLSGLSALADLYDRYSTQIEYWEQYEGQRIRIRQRSVSRTDEENELEKTIRQTTYGVEGTVEDVMSYPSGFLLSDVKEYVRISDLGMSGAIGSSEVQHTYGKIHGQQDSRHVDQKFVSFDSIEELEFVGQANEREPFREEDNEE